jgi:hypothetical protein
MQYTVMFDDFADIKTIKRKSYVPLAKRMTMKKRLGLLLSSLIQNGSRDRLMSIRCPHESGECVYNVTSGRTKE